MRIALSLCLAAVVLVGVSAVESSGQQAGASSGTTTRNFAVQSASPFDRAAKVNYPLFSQNFASAYGSNKETREVSRRISKAVAGLKSDDAAKRDAARADLEKATGELFDLRTKSREKQITDLEKRLRVLRDQLNARTEKKAEIVRLRIQTLVNEANGLAF